MTNKFAVPIAFFAGLAVGSVAAWYLVKEKYAQIAEQEIASVKEVYSRREEKSEPPAEASEEKMAVIKNQNKPSIIDYAQKLQELGYVDYSRTVESRLEPRPEMPPYVISPDEFGEVEEYTNVSLTYFADGILADEYGEIIENVDEIIGDGLEHFGEYEDDSVFVRNDIRRCDYEILKDLREFDEFLKTLPPKH